jgi:23S rRNA-intervening sequence protein
MKIYFDHEKLDVYREAINFCAWVGKFLAAISAKAAAKDQLDRASTSIPLNIAEGNGKLIALVFLRLRVDQLWNALLLRMSWSPGNWQGLDRSRQRRKVSFEL